MNCFDLLTVVLCDQALHMSHLILPISLDLRLFGSKTVSAISKRTFCPTQTEVDRKLIVLIPIGYMIKTYCSVERVGMWFRHWITISIQLALKLLSNWDFSFSQETFFQTSTEIRIQTISGHWYSVLIKHCYTFLNSITMTA